MQKLHLKPSAHVIADYYRLFVNRRAYILQSDWPNPESGRHYYYRPTNKKTGEGLSLTADTIRRHLQGEITIGLYSINPVNHCSKWVAIDADYQDALQDLIKLGFYLKRDGVDSALEKSRRGGHLWLFFAEPLLARDSLIYVYDLAWRAGIPVKGGGQREGIEVFPKHDAVKPGEFGHAIRGPLGIHRGAAQRFWFYGAAEGPEAQMRYLRSLCKLTSEQLARLIAGKAAPSQLAPPDPGAARGMSRRPVGPEFRILDHLGTDLRQVGRNHVTQCPACAAEGHDRGRDNLSISIADPHKYICWAGCTRDMIRAAVGRPSPAPPNCESSHISAANRPQPCRE